MRFFRQTLLVVCLVLPCALLAQPIPSDDSFSTAEDTGTTFDIVANDTDIDPATVDLNTSTLTIDPTFSTAEGTFAVNAAGLLTFTPVLNFNGTATLPYTIQDNQASPVTSSPVNIIISVTPVNDAPTISALFNESVFEDGSVGPLAFTLTDVDNAVATLTTSGSASIPAIVDAGGFLFAGAGASRTVSVTPLPDQSGLTIITIEVTDGLLTASTTFNLTVNPVNDAPVLSALTDVSTPQNTTSAPAAFTVTDIDTPLSSLIVTGSSVNPLVVSNAGIQLVEGVAGNWTVSVVPESNQSGTSNITLTVSDGALSDSDIFLATVTPEANTNPTITSITSQVINEDGATLSLPFTIGDAETPTTLTVSAASSNNVIVPDGNIIVTGSGLNRIVVVTPDPNQNGVVNITLTVDDPAGGTISTVFQLTINAVNDNPSINSISNQIILEDGVTASIPFTLSDLETPTTLVVSGSSSNTAIVPNSGIVVSGTGVNRTVVVTPAPNQNGAVTITLDVDDLAGGTATANFQLTISPVNDNPAISVIANQAINANTSTASLAFTVSDLETPAGALTITPASSNTTVIPLSGIVLGGSAGSRTVMVTPAAGQSGTVDITLTLNDGNGGSAQSVFQVAINQPVNTNPTITTIANQIIQEDAVTGAIAFVVGDAETPGALTVTAVSSNQAIVPNTSVVVAGAGANRTVTVTPNPNQNGVVAITLTVVDSDGGSASRNFNVTINSVDDNPTITAIASQSTNEDVSLGPLTFTVADIDTPVGSLVVTSSSTNAALVPVSNIVITGVGATRLFTVSPAVNQSGTSTITLTVSDGTGNAQASFPLVVNAINDSPTITAISDQTINEDGQTALLNFSIADVETTAGSLVVTASSSNTALVDAGGITINGGGANRTIRITPLANQSGSSTITVRLSDGILFVEETFQVTVNAVDDVPTITSISAQSINQNSQTGPLAVTINDVETLPALLTLVPTSSNLALVDNTGFQLIGSGSLRSLNVIPKLNQSGTTTITLTVSDGAQSAQTAFLLSVAAVDLPPSIDPIADIVLSEDVASGNISFMVGDTDSPIGGLVVTGTTSNAGLIPVGNINLVQGVGANWTVSVTPVANASGVANITLTVTDDMSEMATTSFQVTVNAVNDLPTISPGVNQSTPEEVATTGQSFTIGDIETAAAGLTLIATSSNTTLIPNGSIAITGGGATRTVVATPALDQTGVSTLTLTVTDANGGQATTTYNVTVTPVNDLPTISAGANQSTPESTPTSPQAFTVGDIETSAAGLTITATSSNTTLVPNANIVAGGSGANRTIVVTPETNLSGVTTITVTVTDANSGQATTTFNVTVNAVNDPPTISSVGDQVILEDQSGGTGPLPFTVGDPEGSTVTVTRTSSNTALVPTGSVVLGGSGANRTVNVSSAPNQYGTSTITLTASDGALTAVTTFVVTVTSVNDLPTITTIVPQIIDEGGTTGAVAFTIDDVETDPTTLTVTGTSSNTTLVPTANVVLGGSAGSRTVTITPAPGQNGTSTIELTVSDGSATAISSFPVTVNSVDDPPTISAIGSQSTNEDTPSAAIAFTIGDPDTAIGSLVLSASSSNATLVPNGNIVFGGSGANRDVVITPAANQNGTTSITINLTDGVHIVPRVFTLTVVSINDAPTITAIANQITDEDVATGDLSFTINDIETPAASLTVSAASDNTTLVPLANITLAGTGASRTVKITPAADLSGVANITITVNDGTVDVTRVFQVTVNSVNDAPTVTAITDQTIVEDTPTGPISFTIGDVETAIGSLVITRSSSNTTLFPTANVVLGGSGASRTVNVTPATNRTGTATITITVDDGSTTTTRDFIVTVTPVDDTPTITAITGRTINEDESTGNIAFTIADPETPAVDLIVTAVSSDPLIVASSGITLGGTTGARTISIQPELNQNGVVTISVTVSDGVNSASRNFNVTVNSVNDLPVVTAQVPLNINESEPLVLTLGQLTVFDPDNTAAQLTLLVTGGANYFLSGPTTITPAATFNGVLDVPVYVQDQTGLGPVYHLMVTVNSTNDAPVITGQSPLTTNEDQDITLQISNFNATDPDTPIGNVSLVISPGTNYTFTGTTITPAANYNGLLFVNVRAFDGALYSSPTFVAQITVSPVNDPPVITAQSTLSTPEETSLLLTAGNFTITDPEGGTFSLSVSDPLPGANYTRTGNNITPAIDFNGVLTVPVTVSDGFLNSVPYNVTVTVTPVNDAPVITGQVSLSTVEDIPITLAIANLTIADVDNSSGFILNILPGTDYTFSGTTITPTLDFSGILNVNVQVSDGSSVNALSNVFVVNVNVTDDADAPIITAQGSVSLPEDTSREIVKGDITVSDIDTPAADLVLSVLAGTNYTFVDNTITPAPNFFGNLVVNVRIYDGEAFSNTFPLQVTVTGVNDLGSFNAIANLNILEDAALQTITITGITAGTGEMDALSFVYVSDNTALIPIPVESPKYNGTAATNTITLKPVANMFGTANITVTIIDLGETASKTFSVNVTSVNDAPTLTALTVGNIIEDAPEQLYPLTGITAGGAGTESTQVLSVISSIDNQIADVTVDYTGPNASTGTLRIKPKPNAFGTMNVSVRVQDDGSGTSPNVNFFTRTLAVVIDPVNDDPIITSTPPKTAEPGTPYVYDIVVTDADGDDIIIAAPGLPAWLTLTQISNGIATLSGTPPAGTSGDVAVQLFVSDPTTTLIPGGFVVAVNSRPFVSNVSIMLAEDAVKDFVVGDFSPGFGDGDGNPLAEITITSLPEHGQLLKAGSSIGVGDKFASSDISSLKYVPTADYFGLDAFGWNGADGFFLYSIVGANVNITVTPVNDVPKITFMEDEVLDTLKYELGSERPVALTSKFDAIDPDGDDITGADINFKGTDNYQFRAENDRLEFTNTSKITGTYVALTGILTLKGAATAAEYVSAIRSIKYVYANAQDIVLDTRSVNISIRDNTGSSPSRSRTITLIYTFEDLSIPSAFSPNGDSYNQTWKITSPSGPEVTDIYSDADIKVFNRHGTLLFQTKGFDAPWDGQYNGSLLPSDTYFYTIDLKYNRVRYKGTVTLLR